MASAPITPPNRIPVSPPQKSSFPLQTLVFPSLRLINYLFLFLTVLGARSFSFSVVLIEPLTPSTPQLEASSAVLGLDFALSVAATL